MVTYMNKKYSLEPKYIGKIVFLEVSGDFLKISYDNKLIATHKLSEKKIIIVKKIFNIFHTF